MTRAESPTAWALAASLLLHALAFLAIAGFGSKALERSRTLLETVDVWSGDTVIVTDLTKAPAAETASEPHQAVQAPGVTKPEEATPESAASKQPTRSKGDDWMRIEDQVDEDDTPKARKSSVPDTPNEDALAAKILAYRPRVAAPEEPEPSPPPTATSVGAAGPRGPPRQLARAFTRAIPAANTYAAIWDRLPLGDAGSIVVDLTVDGLGAISESHVHDKPAPPPRYLQQLVERTLLALKGGRFVLSGASSGPQSFRIDVTLSERAIGTGPLELGFEPPRPGHPGRGYFQLPSGRFVEARVTIL